MYTLARRFSFESAHRLANGYVGKCSNIHGHSFQGELVVSCDVLDACGIGIDYSELKRFIKLIEAELDHTLLLYQADFAIIELCKQTKMEYKTFNKNPTSETIAQYIFQEATRYFGEKFPDITVSEVSIAETCTCKCTYKA